MCVGATVAQTKMVEPVAESETAAFHVVCEWGGTGEPFASPVNHGGAVGFPLSRAA